MIFMILDEWLNQNEIGGACGTYVEEDLAYRV